MTEFRLNYSCKGDWQGDRNGWAGEGKRNGWWWKRNGSVWRVKGRGNGKGGGGSTIGMFVGQGKSDWRVDCQPHPTFPLLESRYDGSNKHL